MVTLVSLIPLEQNNPQKQVFGSKNAEETLAGKNENKTGIWVEARAE